MHHQLSNILLLIAAGSLGSSSPIPIATGMVTIQTTTATPTPTTSFQYTLGTTPLSPPTWATSTSSSSANMQPTLTLTPRKLEDWYTDNHRALNKFGRFVFRVTSLGKRIFLQLTSTVSHVHDENDEMIDISALSPEELDVLIHGLNLTTITDGTTNQTTYLNTTGPIDINLRGALLRRDASDEDTIREHPNKFMANVGTWFRNLGYTVKSWFVTEMLNERAEREKLRNREITQQQFDFWLERARAVPTTRYIQPSKGSSELEQVNEQYTRWATAMIKYIKRPQEFEVSPGGKEMVNPDFIAWYAQGPFRTTGKFEVPTKYHFNGSITPAYFDWKLENIAIVGPYEAWLQDGCINPTYVHGMLGETIRPETRGEQTRYTPDGKLNPVAIVKEIQDAKTQNRPAQWNENGVTTRAYLIWVARAEMERAERTSPDYINKSKRSLEVPSVEVPDFDADSEDGEEDWEAWKARVRAGTARRSVGARKTAEDNAETREVFAAFVRGGHYSAGEYEIFRELARANAPSDADWEELVAYVRAGHPVKRQLLVPDFDAESEDGEEDWEAWKARVRAGKQHGKRSVDIPDFDEESEDGEEDWEAWKARVRAGKVEKRDGPIAKVVEKLAKDPETQKAVLEEWNHLVELMAKTMTSPDAAADAPAA